MSYIFGPVPSRRLGFSLGVDPVPFKTCSLNCVYCQLGRTTRLTTRRRRYVEPDEILDQLDEVLALGQRIDYITLSGSGEPTLNSGIGELISSIKERTQIPVAVLTNGTLLFREGLRSQLLEADLVIPSIDAVDQEVFEAVNRPHPSLKIERVIEGIGAFGEIFPGKIWMEVMLVKGLNDDDNQIQRMAEVLQLLRPDRIQLNTPVRPPAESWAEPLSRRRLEDICRRFGPKCQVIAEFSRKAQKAYTADREEAILSLLSRRPVTVTQISQGLGMHRNEVIKYVETLTNEGKVSEEIRDGQRYFRRRIR
ncbi:MAG: hypothetical protein B1H40_00700 [Candidatus Latescibacteria bacterium 4484_181]|nr:MAG: hypothetical protein B1H40_00700 [Candidatus Latescibacteria bacterium 4484_181]RKY69026.1 MAG: radical SAM protein [Candidatus Latescibacterota bacterium]RKY74036.1 MAG: radical SAM protein [Candidatus Latescibacterota bacterium]HDN67668.1 radical SAM protein [Bacillota bacterium]